MVGEGNTAAKSSHSARGRGYVGAMVPCADGNLQLQTHADTILGDPEHTWEEYIYPEGHTQS